MNLMQDIVMIYVTKRKYSKYMHMLFINKLLTNIKNTASSRKFVSSFSKYHRQNTDCFAILPSVCLIEAYVPSDFLLLGVVYKFTLLVYLFS